MARATVMDTTPFYVERHDLKSFNTLHLPESKILANIVDEDGQRDYD